MYQHLDRVNRFICHPIQQLVVWFRDLTFRRLLQNAGWLLSGNSVGALLGLIETAVKTRVLGVEQFGILAIIAAYVALIQQLATCQPWQALIKYGAEALKEERYDKFLGQVKLSFLLDGVGAVIGTAIAVGGAYLLASLQVWKVEISHLAAMFSFTLLFNLSGTPTGILRLLDRFELIVAQNILTSFLTFAGALVVYFLDGGIWGFLVVMLISSIVGNILFVLMAWVALRKRGLTRYWRAPAKEWKPALRFSGWTYISSTLDIPVKQLDIIIVSAVISLEAVGIYKIIKQVISLLAMLADPIYQAVYPQFATMIADHDHNRAVKYALKIGAFLLAVMALPAFLLAVTSFSWLGTVFGEGFTAGAVPLSLFLFLKVFSLGAIAIHPLFTAMGYMKQNSLILLMANLLYLTLAWYLGDAFGLFGLALAYGFQFSIVAGLKTFYIYGKRPQPATLPTG